MITRKNDSFHGVLGYGLLLSALFALVLMVGCSSTSSDNGAVEDSDSAEKTAENTAEKTAEQPQYHGNETVVILKTTQGSITVRFFPETSPEHTKNFVENSKSGLYTGTLFHRVIPGFMIQGGDPNSKDENPNNDGMGG